MQIRVSCGIQKLVKRLPWVINLSVDTKNTAIGDFVKKLEHFIFFRLELC